MNSGRDGVTMMIRTKYLFLISTILLLTFHCYSKTFLKHQVKDGESLSLIGAKYNVSVEAIRISNNLKKNAPLIKGKILNIPMEGDFKEHIVAEGENLFRIGLKHNITVDRLCKINGFSENVKLFTGMKIFVPDNDADKKTITTSTVDKQPATTSTISAKQKINGERDFIFHTIQKGETLYRIGKTFHVPVAVLMEVNGISDSTILKPGVQIKIPKAKYETQTASIEQILQRHKNGKKYLNYSLPLKGDIVPYVKSHYRGILIFNKNDREVRSIDRGIVSHIENTASFGLIVFIRHANGLVSTYSGFSVIYVRKDQEVYPGDIIGKSGEIALGQSPGILYSLQEGDKALAFDMKMHKFYK